jgi:hypothetical protein
MTCQTLFVHDMLVRDMVTQPSFPVTDEELTARAFRAYFMAARKEGSDSPDQPANTSGVEEVGDKRYVVLRSVQGILAVFRVRNDGLLKRLKRWPEGVELKRRSTKGRASSKRARR